MGYEYKTVQAPSSLEARSSKDVADTIKQYGHLITSEAQDGWEYHSMTSMVVSQPVGCSLFGKRVNVHHYMLVFQRKISN